MDTKHTPPPWFTDLQVLHDNEGDNCIFVYGPEGLGMGRVAMVYAECGYPDDLEANAQLIARAPELLVENARLHTVIDHNELLVTSNRNLERALTERVKLTERQRVAIAELVEALKPLASLDVRHLETRKKDYPIFGINDTLLLLGDIRRACAVLAKYKE